ncbi:hypothetical protein R1flu_023130 [Riccia fluitans]|uniref:VPS9 domain-containing protein n=1 Tax=Riccia fluitans TaxID=41844 RepID=A0ABD1XR63_9MARC
MENTDMFNNATAQLTFHDFLDRMRHPSAADLVRSIKNFIGAFSGNPPDPEKDSQSVQDFLANTESAFKAHPLWAGATDEELESSGEGLEKYLMTKLHSKAFAPLPEDAEIDEKLTEKMTILQEFIRPEHLDIPENSQNESSWLLAQKELQRINTYKSPRDKLVCILNCCRVINNLLVKASMASNDSPPGADDFLPVLIYVVIKANPPQLHSNLQYIQRYRHQGRLVSEAAYFFTNLVSAESFIENMDSSSLSMDRAEFEKRMHAGRLTIQQVNGVSTPPGGDSSDFRTTAGGSPQKITKSPSKPPPTAEGGRPVKKEDKDKAGVTKGKPAETESASRALLTVDKLEEGAGAQILEADQSGQLRRDYPFLYSSAGDLRVADVEALLHEYKELVLRYVSLRKALGSSLIPEKPSTGVHDRDVETDDTAPPENSMAAEKQETDISHPLRDSSGISERLQSVSQPPSSFDLRDEVSPSEPLDPKGTDSSRDFETVQGLPEGNQFKPTLEELSTLDKHLPSLSPEDVEEVSDLLDTKELGPGALEQSKGDDKLEVELVNADESKVIASEATAPQQDGRTENERKDNSLQSTARRKLNMRSRVKTKKTQ